jgi:hypothetical protein
LTPSTAPPVKLPGKPLPEALKITLVPIASRVEGLQNFVAPATKFCYLFKIKIFIKSAKSRLVMVFPLFAAEVR